MVFSFKLPYLNAISMYSNNTLQITNNKSQRGVSLYLAFMIMSMVLGIAFGISALLIDQFKSLRGLGYSSFALEAADAGIEKIFYDDKKSINVLTECPISPPDPTKCTQSLSNGASYAITVVGPGISGCPLAVTYCATSKGTFQSSSRKIRIAR